MSSFLWLLSIAALFLLAFLLLFLPFVFLFFLPGGVLLISLSVELLLLSLAKEEEQYLFLRLFFLGEYLRDLRFMNNSQIFCLLFSTLWYFSSLPTTSPVYPAFFLHPTFLSIQLQNSRLITPPVKPFLFATKKNSQDNTINILKRVIILLTGYQPYL